VAIVAAHLGGEHDGERLLRPLRAAGSAILDTCDAMPAAGLVHVAGDPTVPVPALGDGFMIDALAADAAAVVAERIVEDALSPLSVLEVRHLGGALGRAPARHGALATLDGAFSIFASGVVATPAARGDIEGRLSEVRATLQPWTTPQALPNWGDRPVDPTQAFAPDVLRRLRRIREAYDPDGVILAKPRIAPTEAA
jgi:hypothetical protein